MQILFFYVRAYTYQSQPKQNTIKNHCQKL